MDEGDLRITPEALEDFILIASCTPLPMCILSQKGFVHYANEEFDSLVHIPIESGFPFVGRFLESASSVEVRRSLERLVESEERTSVDVDCIWVTANIIDESVNNHYSWKITGRGGSRLFVLSGRYGRNYCSFCF